MEIFTCISFVFLLFATTVATSPTSSNNSKAREFNTTTVFTKIIPSTDISQEAIYTTPSLIFVGKSDGNILRCLFSSPSVCEGFESYSPYPVLAIVLSGEYLYAARSNGVMLRCSMHEKNSCKVFNDNNSQINALTITGGYIHAALQNGELLRCDLHQPSTCRIFYKFQAPVTCLASNDTYIYAGLESKELWRCPVSSENSCRMFDSGSEFPSYLKGILIRKNVYGITKGGTLLECSHGGSCKSKSLPGADYTNAMEFDGTPFLLQSSRIWRCDWSTFTCTLYDQSDNAVSMSFTYSTYKMQDKFFNEDKTCLFATRCPPFVTYYKVSERSALEVFVKDGKLYNSQGILVDTRDADVGKSGRAAIFAMGQDGQILLSNVHNTVLKTSSLFAGQPVASVGEIVVEEGIIRRITACSDNYRPDVELNQQVIKVLENNGYKNKFDSLPCCRDNECSQVNDGRIEDSSQ